MNNHNFLNYLIFDTRGSENGLVSYWLILWLSSFIQKSLMICSTLSCLYLPSTCLYEWTSSLQYFPGFLIRSKRANTFHFPSQGPFVSLFEPPQVYAFPLWLSQSLRSPMLSSQAWVLNQWVEASLSRYQSNDWAAAWSLRTDTSSLNFQALNLKSKQKLVNQVG